ncbi:MAG: iron-containing alcohol dehydrogenase [Anaerolineales bacterium]
MAAKVSKLSGPKVLYHGPGALSELDTAIDMLGGKRIVLVTDPGLVEAGIVDQTCESTDYELLLWDGVEPDPPYELVHQCVDFIKENECNLVIGLGGGSSMDVAKMSAALARNEGKVTDYWAANSIPKPGLPVIAIPTTAGTSSELSPNAVFTDADAQAKRGITSNYLLADVAIADATLTLGLPQPLTAATGMDALTHAIEAYVSKRATLVSDAMAEQGIALIGEYLRPAYARGQNLDARTGMMSACVFAGEALGEAGVGIVHSLAHVLGGQFQIPHGVANALLLPYVMEFNRIGCREKYAYVASLLGENVQGLSLDEASRRGVEAVRGLSQDVNIPQRLRDLDVPQEALEKVAKVCLETQDRILTNDPRTINLEEAIELLHKAY